MANKLDKKYAQGEFIACFEDEVSPVTAEYLIKKEGLRLKRKNNKIIQLEKFSNSYYVICPIGDELKCMKLLSKKLHTHIKWASLRNLLSEERAIIIENIKVKLEAMEESDETGSGWLKKVNEVKYLLSEL